MSTILEHRTSNVTTGVIDKNVIAHDNLVSVTFLDKNDTAHTVFAHKEGPFQTAEDIVRGWETGILHVYATHQDAINHWVEREGAADFVKLLESVSGSSPPAQSQSGGGF
jgi:hypothetical protein